MSVMLSELFPIGAWLALFVVFFWAARSPRRVVAVRRSFLLENAPVSARDLWILRGLSLLCIVCATYATLATGRATFVLALVPVAFLLHLFIEARGRGLLARLAGRYWTVRLAAMAAWTIAVLAWRDGAQTLAVLLACAGAMMAVWPGSVGRFLANYATEETHVKWTRATGIAGCVMSFGVLVVLTWFAIGGLPSFHVGR